MLKVFRILIIRSTEIPMNDQGRLLAGKGECLLKDSQV